MLHVCTKRRPSQGQRFWLTRSSVALFAILLLPACRLGGQVTNSSLEADAFPLAATIQSKSLMAETTFTVAPSGGVAPFTYSLSGIGTLSGTTYTAPAAPGAAIITIADSMGHKADLPVTVVAPIQISSNRSSTCVLFSHGRIKCWGQNSTGQLGYGDIVNRGSTASQMGNNLGYVDLGTGRTVTALAQATSATSMCAILDNGRLKCWGFNGDGELGLGDTTDRGSAAGQMGDNLPYVELGAGKTVVAAGLGKQHGCALLSDHSIKCWGLNTSGQLGYEDTISRGIAANQMGDNLPAINLGTGRYAISLSVGTYLSCAILDDYSVKCWGQNDAGQGGQGDLTITHGGAPGEMGNGLPAVALGAGRTATSISVAGRHACAVLDNGSAKCWGYNTTGQLGQGDTTLRGTSAAHLGDSLLAIDLGMGRTATSLAMVGFNHGFGCAVLDNGRLKCWGANDKGQLGYGDTTTRGHTGGQMGDNLAYVELGTGRTVRAVTAQTHNPGDWSAVCALLDNYKVKCWGGNGVGGLGYGDTTARGVAAGQMGDSLPYVDLGTTL